MASSRELCSISTFVRSIKEGSEQQVSFSHDGCVLGAAAGVGDTNEPAAASCTYARTKDLHGMRRRPRVGLGTMWAYV